MSHNNLKLDEATREDLVLAYLSVQKRYEDQGVIPKAQESLLSEHKLLLEKMGAVHLGLTVAAFSILFNFVLVNLLLHLLPS